MRSYDDYSSSPGAAQERRVAPIYGAYDSNDGPRSSYAAAHQDRELSLQHRLQGEALYGVSPVAAAIAAGRRKLYTLYIQEGMHLHRSHSCSIRPLLVPSPCCHRCRQPAGTILLVVSLSSFNRVLHTLLSANFLSACFCAGLKAGKRNDAGACKAAIAAAEAVRVNIEEVPKHELNLACDNRPHQVQSDDSDGMWSKCEAFNMMTPAVASCRTAQQQRCKQQSSEPCVCPAAHTVMPSTI